eukprot:Partr_v1_DN27641_c2_g1_i1_m65062 putative Transcription factor
MKTIINQHPLLLHRSSSSSSYVLYGLIVSYFTHAGNPDNYNYLYGSLSSTMLHVNPALICGSQQQTNYSIEDGLLDIEQLENYPCPLENHSSIPECSSSSSASGDSSADTDSDLIPPQLSPMLSANGDRKDHLPGLNHHCANCHISTTPLWRRSPDGHGMLCNACGLYYKTNNCHRPMDHEKFSSRLFAASAAAGAPLALTVGDHHHLMPPKKKKRKTPPRSDIHCSNCGNSDTPLWRKNENGQPLCNACGLYWKFHGYHKPVMKNLIVNLRDRQSSESESECPRTTGNFCGKSGSDDSEMRRVIENGDIASWTKDNIQNHSLGLIKVQKALECLNALRRREPPVPAVENGNWKDVTNCLSDLNSQISDFLNVVSSLAGEQ